MVNKEGFCLQWCSQWLREQGCSEENLIDLQLVPSSVLSSNGDCFTENLAPVL